MIATRATSGLFAGWMSAVIFNGLILLLMPLLGARILASGFSGVSHDGPPTAETLAETRLVINQAFENISGSRSEARSEWAAHIEEQLDQRNMAAARGFMLAAPQMLNGEDQRAIRAAAEAEPSGTEDQRLLRAALLFLPSEIRLGYETSTKPRGLDLLSLTDIDGSGAGELVQLASASRPALPGSSTELTIGDKPAFSVLGTPEDLVSRSRDWMRGNYQRSFELRLTGLAMASPPSATSLTQEDLTIAASILKTAYRSARLQPEYRQSLEERLSVMLPDAILEANLEDALADINTLEVRSKRVQDAFAKSIDPTLAEEFGPELLQIAQIANATSARGTLDLIEHAKTPADISRARLIARAGGDRSVALASHLGADALALTSSGMRWSRSSVLNLMMLVASAFVLLFCVASVLRKMLIGHYDDALL